MKTVSGYKRFFDTLANKTRLDIIHSLQEESLNVTKLTEKLPYDQSTISHNLKRLKTCKFVNSHKEGKKRYYKLNKETIDPLLELIDTHVDKFCSKACKDDLKE
jgi:DNA-binding transcriptional ArsR family regulator